MKPAEFTVKFTHTPGECWHWELFREGQYLRSGVTKTEWGARREARQRAKHYRRQQEKTTFTEAI